MKNAQILLQYKRPSCKCIRHLTIVWVLVLGKHCKERAVINSIFICYELVMQQQNASGVSKKVS